MITDLLYNYIKEYISQLLLGRAVHAATTSAEKTSNYSTALSAGVKAGAEAGSSVASTPYVGAILALAAAASVIGYIVSQVNSAKSADIGTPYSQGGRYKVHANEYMDMPRGARVFTAPDSNRIDYESQQSGQQPQNISVVVNNPSSSFIKDFERMIRNKQADSFVSALRIAQAGY